MARDLSSAWVVSPGDHAGVTRLVEVARLADPARAHDGEEDIAGRAAADPRGGGVLAKGNPPSAAALGRIESWDEPTGLWMDLWIPPGAHAGSGAALWRAIVEHCARERVDLVRAAVPENHVETLAFLASRGFAEVERDQESVLRMRERPPLPSLARGVQVVSLAQNPDLLAGVREVDAEALLDVPGEDGVALAMPDEAWWACRIDRGEFRPATIVAACEEERVLA